MCIIWNFLPAPLRKYLLRTSKHFTYPNMGGLDLLYFVQVVLRLIVSAVRTRLRFPILLKALVTGGPSTHLMLEWVSSFTQTDQGVD